MNFIPSMVRRHTSVSREGYVSILRKGECVAFKQGGTAIYSIIQVFSNTLVKIEL